MGWASTLGFISNCLMAGDIHISSEGGDVICRNNSNAILTDTYYLTDWHADIPAAAISTDAIDMRSGALCLLLNAGRTDDKAAWFQTLAEDPYPVPDNRHLPVWLYDGAYVNENPDGIDEIKNEKLIMKDEGAVYDLSGRKVVNGKWLNGKWNGIYIKNGKKYVK